MVPAQFQGVRVIMLTQQMPVSQRVIVTTSRSLVLEEDKGGYLTQTTASN